MATALTLFCLAIDNHKVPIGNIFKLETQSDDDTSDLRELIKANMAPRLDHLVAGELIVWKLLKLLHIESIEEEIGAFNGTIQGIKSPSPKIQEVFRGTDTIQALSSASQLSRYWENSPDRGHLHLIVQSPLFETPESKQSININRVRETAHHLYRTLWKNPLDPILATVVPDSGKTYMYVPQDQLSNLRVNYLGYNEKALLFLHEYSLARKEIEKESKRRRESRRDGIIIAGDPGLDETWAFTKDLLPCHSFLHACNSNDAFVVQTSYPDVRRYKTWRKEYNTYTYVMDCFPLTELVALGWIQLMISSIFLPLSIFHSMLHGFNVQLIKDHCEKWGPSARIMMALLREPGLIPEHTRRVKEAARHFIHHFGVHTYDISPSPLSHTLFTIHPEGLTSEKRPIAIMRIETSYLNCFVIEAIAAQDLLPQSKFYFGVSHHSWFKSSAGYMFDMAVLSWLCVNSESKELTCTPARSASPQLTIPVCQGWCMLSYKDPDTLKYLSDCKRPFCVIPIPASKAFPGVDAMIFTDDHIITIQVMIAPEHSVKSRGLVQIPNSLAKAFRKSRKW
ncbi:hypothetical protein B0F90DRAFT_1821336 [Multifurca ochricompacta]|uniref:Crinkler effector protein N-terminal domain-containing protein n=1 Tax=Multifurca ochricompacta TaxID=376703 RepID=A0AAD4QKG0_9AGAM|nr:hypothetical protein B0F90DRAFT_1821336 [Multifurca ochricompacta]